MITYSLQTPTSQATPTVLMLEKEKQLGDTIGGQVDDWLRAIRENRFATPQNHPLLDMEADFPQPRSNQLLAEEQRQFLAALPHPYYDVELPEED